MAAPGIDVPSPPGSVAGYTVGCPGGCMYPAIPSAAQRATASRQTWLAATLVLACASCGVALLPYATPWGIGVGNDSAHYLGAARNLLAGHGYSLPAPDGVDVPELHFPPLYPVIPALAGLLSGQDPIAVARPLQAALFGATIALVGLLCGQSAGNSPWAALVGALLVLCSPELLANHMGLQSEGAFFLFGLLGLLGLL